MGAVRDRITLDATSRNITPPLGRGFVELMIIILDYEECLHGMCTTATTWCKQQFGEAGTEHLSHPREGPMIPGKENMLVLCRVHYTMSPPMMLYVTSPSKVCRTRV